MSYEHPLWVKEATRAFRQLRIFRLLMFKLKFDEPELYQRLEMMRADIDTRHQSLYDRHKVNQTNNGSTTSQPPQK